MSKINPALYSSESHDWMTPPELIDAVLKFEGVERFDLDAACTERNIPAWNHYQSTKIDALQQSWHEHPLVAHPLVWLNPPYGDLLAKFMKKAAEEAQKGARIWVLIPARTETRYQHESGLTVAGFTVFLKGRLKFLKDGKPSGTAPFPTILLYYGDDWEQKATKWANEQPWPGTLMIPYENQEHTCQGRFVIG